MPDKNNKVFAPVRMASWWCVLEDILWPEAGITDKIKRRAEGFAKAGIDTAINFGFHARFDFADYFSSLHGYLANVSEELSKYGIRYMDHYSCNVVERPRGEGDFRKLHGTHRHHVLLHHDPIAAEHSQYAGHRFHDICEVDVRDGSRGYSWIYQCDLFCHNNPGFLDMHRKYLNRLIREVPMDGIQVDDMCDYGGLSTCCCRYCRDRFRRDYGHELPDISDKSFWGDTSGDPFTWGNYDNPVFRDWLRMKADSVADHVKLVKETVGDIPLMTCCSSTGPIRLNAISLNLERMKEHLDFFMLENCGINVHTVQWVKADAEALQQKAIALCRANSPAIACSYTIYDAGAYLGWCLSRFWGVGNWSSTLTGRLAREPEDAAEIQELVSPVIQWEICNSNLNYREGQDVPEVRLVSNRYCRDNGWRDHKGAEHWDRVSAWSGALVEANIGYRFVLADELEDAESLKKENTPLILDGAACVSEKQYRAVRECLEAGKTIWLGLPFGIRDEKGIDRPRPLSEELLARKYRNLFLLDGVNKAGELERLSGIKAIQPRIVQVSGDKSWCARFRNHPQGLVMHLLNSELKAVPHPEVKDRWDVPILKGMESSVKGRVEYVLDFCGLGTPWSRAYLMSPELGDEKREVAVRTISEGKIEISADFTGIKVYGVIQPQKNITF